jgi:hypothetical protein
MPNFVQIGPPKGRKLAHLIRKSSQIINKHCSLYVIDHDSLHKALYNTSTKKDRADVLSHAPFIIALYQTPSLMPGENAG